MRTVLFFTVLLFAITACQKDEGALAPTGTDELSFRTATRPFSGNLVDYVVWFAYPSPVCAPNEMAYLKSEGGGNALHMGKIEEINFNCCYPPFYLDVYGSSPLSNGSTTLIAANGDEVYYTWEGTLDWWEDPATFEGTFTITGGTGRFSGATGGGIVTGTTDKDDPWYTYTRFEGEITY